jgi:hypothetical protein
MDSARGLRGRSGTVVLQASKDVGEPVDGPNFKILAQYGSVQVVNDDVEYRVAEAPRRLRLR